MDELRPWTLGFNRCKNRLVGRVRFAVTDRWIFNQDVILVGNLFELIKQSRGITRAAISRLMVAQPLLSLRPEIALAHINHLLIPSELSRRHRGARIMDGVEQPAPQKQVYKSNDDSADEESENAFTLIQTLDKSPDHRGFPSSRNCA